eukprot:3613384-Lingulodinium_polyedra.AAC.1
MGSAYSGALSPSSPEAARAAAPVAQPGGEAAPRGAARPRQGVGEPSGPVGAARTVLALEAV